MTAYFIGQEGPYTGSVFPLDDGEEWIFGRDRDVCSHELSDPMVSRKHALVRLVDGAFFIENLSTTNPILVNGTQVQAPIKLEEEDVVQIGNNVLRFTQHSPDKTEQDEEPTDHEIAELDNIIPQLTLNQNLPMRWMGKVVSGPNTGAEFGMNPGDSCTLGKDPEDADIVFQDLSVSRQHARFTARENGTLTIEDLGSKNGVFVNGSRIEEPTEIHSQDLVFLGTTSILVIDREQARETIYSPAAFSPIPSVNKEEEETEEVLPKNWKHLFIPTRHLVVASIFSLILLVGVVSMVSLFRAQSVVLYEQDEKEEIATIIKDYPTVEFSFNEDNGNLFIVGHVLTEVELNELLYLLKTLPQIGQIDNNVIVDELVWKSANALLAKNPKWRSILITARQPGQFIMRGYLPNLEEVATLTEYVNRNFSYLSQLKNEVVADDNLQTQIQSLLVEDGFNHVTFQFNNGELVFAGRVGTDEAYDWDDLLEEMKKIQGVRLIRNFVILAGESTTRIDISQNYSVMGTSKYGDVSQYVLINGRILSAGEALDGMVITKIEPDRILLDKDGMKYKIDFNQQ